VDARGAHIHIGAGRLGLGLIAASGAQARLDLHLVHRTSSSVPEPLHVSLTVVGEHGAAAGPSFEIPSVSCSDTVQGLAPAVQTVLRHAPHLLITTAVTTEGLAARRDFLIELAAERAKSDQVRSTAFIAGENDPGPGYPALKAELRALGVDCRDTMVNRVCPSIEADLAADARRVTVDALAEWVIAGRPTGAALGALARVSHVRFVADVEPYEVRKRWLVNGVHLAIAILARYRRLPSIDVAVAEEGRIAWIERLQAVLIGALERRHPGLEDKRRIRGRACRRVAAP
jgi:hypothetical protein